jgi:methionine aminopeptidase
VRRLNPFKLESLDYAPPDRAALQHGALPQVTAEMSISAAVIPAAEQDSDMDRDQIIAELTANDIPAPVREQIVAEAVQPHVAQLTTIRETLGLDADADLAAVIAEMQRKAVDAAQAAVQRHIDELVSEIKIESVRAIIAELVQARRPQTLEDADAAYAAVKESANVKRLLTAQVREMTGPPAVVASKVRGRNLEDTPENRAAAIAATGISI